MHAYGSRRVRFNVRLRDNLCLYSLDFRPFLIQLLRMSDGQPHPSAFSPTIEPPDSWKTWTKRVAQVQLTSSRLAVTFLTSSDVPRFVVWDWKTGVKHVVSSDQLHCYQGDRESLYRMSCIACKVFSSLMSTEYSEFPKLWTLIHGRWSLYWTPLLQLRTPRDQGR